MNMVIFGILQPSTATLQLNKKQNNWNRTTDEEEPAWASESIQRLHPLQCESKRCSTTHCSKSAGDTGIWTHMCMCINLNASILLG